MKTNLKLFFVSTLTIFLFSQGFAQTNAQSGSDNTATGTAVRGEFVDNDKDGVCDNHEAKMKNGQCANFVDKDGNGICDNCPKNANGGQNANCKGHQYGKNCGQGQANCCGRGPCQGKGPGNCCPNKQGPAQTNPAETPDPKK